MLRTETCSFTGPHWPRLNTIINHHSYQFSAIKTQRMWSNYSETTSSWYRLYCLLIIKRRLRQILGFMTFLLLEGKSMWSHQVFSPLLWSGNFQTCTFIVQSHTKSTARLKYQQMKAGLYVCTSTLQLLKHLLIGIIHPKSETLRPFHTIEKLQ